MKRRLALAAVIILTAFLQNGLMQFFQIASIRPNLLLLLTVSFALMEGRREGLLIGFFSGLVLDLCFGNTLGLEALIYMWIGFGAGCCYRIFYDDDIKTPMLLVCAAELVYGFYEYTLLFLLRGRVHFFFYLGRIIIPEMLYTLIFTIFTYRLLYRLCRRIGRLSKRRVDSLV